MKKNNEKKIKIFRTGLLAILSSFLLIIIFSTFSYADTNFCNENSQSVKCVLNKAVLEDVYKCYTQGGVEDQVSMADLKDYYSMFNKDYKIGIPAEVKSTITWRGSGDKLLSCKDIAKGRGKYSGLTEADFKHNGKTYDINTMKNLEEDVKGYMEGLGYSFGNVSSTKEDCFYFEVDREDQMDVQNEDHHRNVYSDFFCANTGSDGKITKLEKKDNIAVKNWDLQTNKAGNQYILKSSGTRFILRHNNGTIFFKDWFDGSVTNYTLDGLIAALKTIIDSHSDEYISVASDQSIKDKIISIKKYSSGVAEQGMFTLDKTNGAKTALYSLSGETLSYDQLKFTDDQALGLYEGYLMQYYGGTVQKPKNAEEAQLYENGGAGEYSPTSWKDTDGISSCVFIKFDKNKNQKVYGLDSSMRFNGASGSGLTKEQVIERIEKILGKNTCAEKKYDVDSTEKLEVDPSTMNESQEDIGTPKDKFDVDKCSEVSGLGWLLCPIIELVANTIPPMYHNMIEPYLQVKTTIFGDDTTQGGVREAWTIFVTIANVLLIIFLLVIVFSQLTGYGIDNYGIKKALPRLLTAAILINLSLIICELVADLANILGYGLYSMFSGFAERMNGFTAMRDAYSKSGIAGAVGANAGIGVVAIGGLVALVAFAPEILLPLLPGILAGLIGAFIGVLFFFIILGVRQAAVIILIAISPLAFACYILPNTKKLFDRWKKLFMGVMLVYPIAGLLMGGGTFASSVIMNAAGKDDTWLQIVALLLNVVPFFFLPSIMKSSMSGLANIGNKISGLGKRAGSRLGGTAGNALKNSNLHQANLEKAKRRGAENRNKLLTDKMKDRAVKNGNYKTKDGKKANSFDELSDEEKLRFNKDHRGLARRSAADNSIIAEDDKKLAERGAAMGSGFLAGSAAAAAQQAGEKGRDIDEQTGETISAYDVDAFDENGNKVLDENGNQKKQKAFYDKKSDSWKVDTGKTDAAGNAIFRNVNKSQMDEIKKAQFGSNPNKVRIGENGEKEFTLNKDTGKYEHNGVVATDDEMKEINDNLAKGQMLQNYTRRNGRGAFTDSLGNTLEGGEGIAAAGFSQSWADLQRTKAAEARAQSRGSTIGGYAGRSTSELSGAAQLSAENEGMSRTNTTLGQADALRDLQGLGYNTATSRISASQAAGTKLTETMKGNVGAMEIERTAGVQAPISEAFEATVEVPLSLKEKAKLVNAAKSGNLDNIIRSADSSEKMKQIAREMKASGQDFTSFGAGTETSASISKFIDNTETALRNERGIITSSERQQLISAAQNGTLSQIATSSLASAGQVALAKQMLSSGKNYSSSDISSIQNEIGALEQVAAGGLTAVGAIMSANDTTETRTRTVQPPAEGVLSIGRTAGQVTNAINAGSTKLVNQFEGQIAGEKVGEVRVDRAVAEHQTQNARTVKEQEQAAYAEALTNEDLWEKDENGNIKRSEDGTPVSLLTVKEERAKNQAQRRIFTTAAQNMLDRTSPDFSTIISDVAIKRKNDEIKAREASIYNDPSNISDSVDALYNKAKDLALKGQRGEKYDEAELRAYINVMVKKGEPGEEAANDLLRLVAPKEGEVPSDVQRTIASHLINNYGSQLKNTSRSTHDYAQAVLSAAAKGTPISYDVDQKYSTNVNSLKAESFTVMNDKEAERLLNALKGENGVSILTAKEAQTLVNKTDEALKNETIRGKLKGKVEDVMKEIISLAATSQSERGFKWAEKSKNSSQGQPEASQPTPDTTSYDNPAGTSSDSTF